LRIGTHLAVGYPVQIINSKRDKGARHDGEVAPVRVVFVVIRGDLRKIIVSFEIVARNPVAVGINFSELPLRQRFASAGGIFQFLDSRSGIARTKTFKTRLQRRPRRRECSQRRLFNQARRPMDAPELTEAFVPSGAPTD